MVESRSKLATILAALNDRGARYVVVGAQAVILWGSTRATRDIDLLIETTEANAQRVLDALSDAGFLLVRDLSAREILERKVTMIGDLWRVDLFTVAWSVRYPEVAAAATVFEVDGVKIPVASIEHLIASKRTGRLQDAADIEILEEIRRLRGQGQTWG